MDVFENNINIEMEIIVEDDSGVPASVDQVSSKDDSVPAMKDEGKQKVNDAESSSFANERNTTNI